ncbi:hypothetical protein H696_05336 [Fonticula alba]|uniref:Uncharacterized protein n=1 Tax=Fonticula alba TaxID=691883 RepID=A0A058Z1E0_FONAL|nr:hypothetical protein H696_05336 [Fonticula alba]KCV68084.1 hypothetical protein H696_05336 [Fonticula alba]|eukprot:XP_009497458.1 hypothetical protein H696_05336 [Fonticula alba]
MDRARWPECFCRTASSTDRSMPTEAPVGPWGDMACGGRPAPASPGASAMAGPPTPPSSRYLRSAGPLAGRPAPGGSRAPAAAAWPAVAGCSGRPRAPCSATAAAVFTTVDSRWQVIRAELMSFAWKASTSRRMVRSGRSGPGKMRLDAGEGSCNRAGGAMDPGPAVAAPELRNSSSRASAWFQKAYTSLEGVLAGLKAAGAGHARRTSRPTALPCFSHCAGGVHACRH